MPIVNLTPHSVDVVGGPTLRPSGDVARVSVTYLEAGNVHGVTLYRSEYGDVEGLPEPAEGTFYVVSGLVRAALPARDDLLSPGKLVRDSEGRVVGCEGLVRN